MDDERLQELRRLCDAATPGPWVPSDEGDGDQVIWGPDQDWFANIGNWARQNIGLKEFDQRDLNSVARQCVDVQDKSDADFICAARKALPELIEEVERLRDGWDKMAGLFQGAMEFGANRMAEARANKADAARYRWLRDGGCLTPDGALDQPRPMLLGDEFDTAIDEAMKGDSDGD